jgi:hypothetical protein
VLADFEPHSLSAARRARISRDLSGPIAVPECSATIANVRFRGLAQALVTSRCPQPLSDDSPRMTTRFAEYSPVAASPSAGHHRSRGIRQRSQPGLSQDARLGLQDLCGGKPRSRGDPMATSSTLQGAHRNPRNLSEASIARQEIRRRKPGLLRGARAGLKTYWSSASLSRRSTAGGFVAGCSPWIS